MTFLLKIGLGKYIEDMYQKEYLFFNTLASFRANEKDPGYRNDPKEANSKIKQLKYLEITLPSGKAIKLHENSPQFNAQYNEHPTIIPNNICSLYSLTFDKKLNYKEIDERVLCLGDKTLIIYNIEKFFEILDNSIEELKLALSRKPVEYYNYKTFDGDLSPHHKEDSFIFQNEYRILLITPGTKTINLKLPGLKKISVIVNTNQINTLKLVRVRRRKLT